MNRIHDYQRKLDERDFLDLLPEQEEVAARTVKELTRNVKASLIDYTAWVETFRPMLRSGMPLQRTKHHTT